MLRLQSPGGTVTGYGLAAAEILRLRERKIKVIASVDQVAASGGYMMACAADRIVAAPFAVVGSIGVVAPVPNLHRLLKRNEIDFEEMTAGEFKRSVSLLGEITPAGREHFRGKLEDTHGAFKHFVQQCRPNVDIDQVANGDHWLASEALALGLVDELSTGDEYLFRARDGARLYEVSTAARKTLVQQLLSGIGGAARAAADFAVHALASVEGLTGPDLGCSALRCVLQSGRTALAREGAFPSPLWGRVREGGRAALSRLIPRAANLWPDRISCVRGQAFQFRATPHPGPPPQVGRGR